MHQRRVGDLDIGAPDVAAEVIRLTLAKPVDGHRRFAGVVLHLRVELRQRVSLQAAAGAQDLDIGVRSDFDGRFDPVKRQQLIPRLRGQFALGHVDDAVSGTGLMRPGVIETENLCQREVAPALTQLIHGGGLMRRNEGATLFHVAADVVHLRIRQAGAVGEHQKGVIEQGVVPQLLVVQEIQQDVGAAQHVVEAVDIL